jgi:hypothetical protein
LLYRIVIHARADEIDDDAFERLRQVLEASELDVTELRRMAGPGGAPLIYIEWPSESPSAYHAQAVIGPPLVAKLFTGAELPKSAYQLAIEAVRAE